MDTQDAKDAPTYVDARTQAILAHLAQEQHVWIVFVCLGNICRSPLAEGIALAMQETYSRAMPHALIARFSSAGTSGAHNGESIDKRSIAIAKSHNLNISHFTSKQINIYRHSDASLFIAMDKHNVATLQDLGFAREKIVLLGDFGLQGAEVPDPYYGGADGFRHVYNMLHAGISCLFQGLYGKK